jgi:predicted GNAT family acetyltransferase
VPVCLSAFNARLDLIVQIGPVWTPSEYRNQGFARFLLNETLHMAKDEGIEKAILFSDTPAAIRAYESIGFQKTGLFRMAILKDPIILNGEVP